jgi:flagellar M-ring protein FliF
MKPLLDFLKPWLEKWKGMPLGQRFGLIVAAALLVGGGIWAWAAANAPNYQVLFGNLEADDASAIIEKLKGSKIPYKLERAGTEIWVPDQFVYETRLQLAGEGLPGNGGQGFELFDQQKFGESEFSEQVKYHRALEGELTRTITHLNGVESARVHLVLPARSVFVQQDSTASASVALKLKPGAKLSRDQIKGIVHLVASSVRGLNPDAVTIVDNTGRRLSEGSEDDADLASNSMEFQRTYERNLERSLQQILDATLGPGRAMTRVAAEVSFAREEVTEERIDPNSVASRSFQITEERDMNASATAGGVPGAVGTLEGADDKLTSTSSDGLSRRSETRNYEISKTVRHTAEPVGRVQRLSVAVVVDGTWKGKGDKRAFVTRTPAELSVIKNVVATAVGTKDERGDRVTVECVPFAEQAAEVAQLEPTGVDALVKKNLPLVAGAGGALLLLIVGGTVFLVMRKKKGQPPSRVELKLGAEAPASLLGGGVTVTDGAAPTLAAIGAGPDSPAAAALPAPKEMSPDAAAAQAEAQAEAERIRAMTAEIASADPYLAARIVRTWLSENNNEEAA